VALLTGAEHADAVSVIAVADVTGRTTRQKLSGRIHSSRHLAFRRSNAMERPAQRQNTPLDLSELPQVFLG
jgi:hypothetical protein